MAVAKKRKKRRRRKKPLAHKSAPLSAETLIGAWQTIVGAQLLPWTPIVQRLTTLEPVLADEIKTRGLSTAGYDLVGAAPELACAFHAMEGALPAPVMEVLASASHRANSRAWAWITLVARNGDDPAVMLVTATQRRCSDTLDADRSLATILDLFATAVGGDRQVLPLSSGVRILPNQTAQITARPQKVALRPTRLMLRDGQDWIVEDIKIGNRSQFSQAGDIPGDMFATNAIDAFISFETCQLSMDISITVTYVGDDPDGRQFFASFLGDATWRSNTEVACYRTIAEAIGAAPELLRGDLAGQLDLRLS